MGSVLLFIKGTRESSLAPSIMGGHNVKLATCDSEEVSPEAPPTPHAGSPILDFQLPELRGIHVCCLKPPFVVFCFRSLS